MKSTPLLEPEAVAELSRHFLSAGREAALGLRVGIRILREGLAEGRDDPLPDPAAIALDETLRTLERGLQLLTLFAGRADASDHTHRDALKTLHRLVEEAAAGGGFRTGDSAVDSTAGRYGSPRNT